MLTGDTSRIHDGFARAYSAAIATGRTPHDRVIWPNRDRQYQRFSELCSFHDLSRRDLSILDIGCGNGELVNYLNLHGFQGRYYGIDLHDGMIAEAQQRFPQSSFERRDILADGAPACTIAVMSGIFNVQAGQSVDYVRAIINACLRAASDAVIFNAITTHVDYREAETFYFDPALATTMAADLSRRFVLKHGTPPFNYTVCVFTR